MKYLALFFLLIGCQSETEKKIESLKEESAKLDNKVDSLLILHDHFMVLFDSVQHYGNLDHEYKIKSMEAHILHLSTGSESEYNKAVRYDEMKAEYGKKAYVFQDSASKVNEHQKRIFNEKYKSK